MLFAWLRRRRRRKLLAQRMPRHWPALFESLGFYARLNRGERRRLEDIARVLIAEKRWEACGGAEIDDAVRVTVAATAALLVLHLEHDYYRRTRSILIYPAVFETADPHGDPLAALGVAHEWGTVALAWDAARHGAAHHGDGRNVILHEFAHRLDMLDHHTDGTPPLRSREQFDRWVRIMTREFEELQEDVERGRRTFLDDYAATEPAEFFAVATEHFFEQPEIMQRHHGELYDLLCDYYRQDPARWPDPK